jgi:opacity protein-like surface antigen
MNRIAAATLLLSAGLVLPASAPAQDLTGLYFAANAGRSRIGYDNNAYADQQAATAAPFGTLDWHRYSLQKRANAWWVSAGYLRWHYAGLEASYLHLGELTYRKYGTFTPTGASAESVVATTNLLSRGPALSLVLRAPIAESLDLTLRVGDYYGRTTLENGLKVTRYDVTRTSTSGSSLLAGAGATYTFDGHWSARLDYLYVSKAGDAATTGRYSVGLVTAGASYTF